MENEQNKILGEKEEKKETEIPIIEKQEESQNELESSEQIEGYVHEDHLNSEAEEEKRKRKKRIDLAIEWALIFILGILVGVAVKTEAKKTITVGFNDRKMKIFSQDYNINQLQKDIADKAKAAAEEESGDGMVPEQEGEEGTVEQVQPDSEGQTEGQVPQSQ